MRERTRPATHPGGFAQDFDPLGLKPEDPEALKEMQTKELKCVSRLRALTHARTHAWLSL